MLIGIDAGGTKTDIVLCDLKGNIINRVMCEKSNPIDIGIEKCVDVILKGVDEVSSGEDCNIKSIFAGISGGSTGENKKLIYSMLSEKLPEGVKLLNDSDAISALNSGIGLSDGAVVISGTGSVGYYRKNNEIIRIGGYGYLLDKGGSGYDFGRDALYYSLSELDKRGEKTVITQMVEEITKGTVKNLDIIYEKGKAYIASFAPIVFKAYRMGDTVAEKIIDDNAKEYAKIFERIAEISGNAVCKVVLSGSMWKEFDIIYKYTKKYLTHSFEFIIPKVPPVYGSIIAAADKIGVFNEEFQRQLKKSFLKQGFY